MANEGGGAHLIRGAIGVLGKRNAANTYHRHAMAL